jgi:hypothetical protein
MATVERLLNRSFSPNKRRLQHICYLRPDHNDTQAITTPKTPPIPAIIEDMDSRKRQQLVDQLMRLPRHELNDVIDECRRRETAQEAGARVLAELFAGKQRTSALGRMGGYQATDNDEE